MKPSELLLTDYVLELHVYDNETWRLDYRTVRAYDSEEAVKRMRDYLRMEGYSVGGVTVKV